MEDAIYGVTLDFMAEMLAKETGLKTQHGEPAYQPFFQEWLTSKGTDWNTYSYAYQGWWERLEADPSGQLHAKFAALQQNHMQQEHFGDVPEASMMPDEVEKEYTLEGALEELGSPVPNARWTAAHHLTNFYDIGSTSETPLLSRATGAIPVLMECLERHDDYTASYANSAARDLVTWGRYGLLGTNADEAKRLIEVCLGRGEEKLQSLLSAFAPIQNQAIPERGELQSKIQDYTSLVDDLQEILAEWTNNVAGDGFSTVAMDFIPAHDPMGGIGATAGPAAQTSTGANGIIAALQKIPFFRSLLYALGF